MPRSPLLLSCRVQPEGGLPPRGEPHRKPPVSAMLPERLTVRAGFTATVELKGSFASARLNWLTESGNAHDPVTPTVPEICRIDSVLRDAKNLFGGVRNVECVQRLLDRVLQARLSAWDARCVAKLGAEDAVKLTPKPSGRGTAAFADTSVSSSKETQQSLPAISTGS